MKSLRRPISAINIRVPYLKNKGNTTSDDYNKKLDFTNNGKYNKKENEINLDLDLDLLFEKQLQKLREINKEYDDELLKNNKTEDYKIIYNSNTNVNTNTNINFNTNNNIVNNQTGKKHMNIINTFNKPKKTIFRSPSHYINKEDLLPKITLSPIKDKHIKREGSFLPNKKIIERNISFISDKNKNRPNTSKSPLHKDYGKVPKYLQEIKKNAEILKDIEKKKKEEEKYPKGTRLLPEEERLLTLRKLEESKKELENLIEKLPITLNSLSSRQKQQKLYKELDEVEKAIVIFSKDQVFVKIDS